MWVEKCEENVRLLGLPLLVSVSVSVSVSVNVNANVNEPHDFQHPIYTKFTNPVKLVATLSPDERITIHDGRRSRNWT